MTNGWKGERIDGKTIKKSGSDWQDGEDEGKKEAKKQTDRQNKTKNSPVETFLQTVSALLTAANATAAMHFLWTARRGRMSRVGRAGEALPKNEMGGK